MKAEVLHTFCRERYDCSCSSLLGLGPPAAIEIEDKFANYGPVVERDGPSACDLVTFVPFPCYDDNIALMRL